MTILSKVNILLLPFVIVLMVTSAVYGGDTPCGATILSTTNPNFIEFSNSGNTDSGVPAPPYGGYMGSDIWFEFTMPSTGVVNFILQEAGMSNPAVAIYEGPCNEPKLLYNIVDHNCNGSVSPAALFDNLTVGQTYYIRIWAENGSGDGNFLLYLNQSSNAQPQFLLAGSATNQGSCIQLTSATNNQQGCTWFEIPIDFTKAFTHNMTANFGNVNANGADGICLIYQANGPNYCGISGGGIGAQGMPNSAIFEFDTWQNGNYNDPVQDHTSFNVNGDMNHINSIAGPSILGNVEDGADHTISFVYDGSGGYQLYFDGTLELSGTYDFINNCFGGSETAWWGYTASTGAANNEHVVCPNITPYSLGTQEYQEAVICEGEQFNGYTQSGFYVDFVSGPNNCLHQVNTSVTVIPLPDPTYIEDQICFGDFYYFEGDYLFNAGIYQVTLQTQDGCDSIVNLELSIIDGEVALISTAPMLNCNIQSLDIDAYFTSSGLGDNVYYNWSTPNGTAVGSSITTSESGTYMVEVIFQEGNLSCVFSDEIYIDIDTLLPLIGSLQDIYLTCDSSTNVDLITAISLASGQNLSYSWYYEGNNIGSSTVVNLIGEGTYILEVINNDNGCILLDTAQVFADDNSPMVNIEGQVLNCKIESFDMQVIVESDSLAYLWKKDGITFSTQATPNITESGQYELIVTNESGCTAYTSIIIEQDTINPNVSIPNFEIPCDTDSLQLYGYTIDSSLLVSWQGSGLQSSETYPSIVNEGTYIITVLDTSNFCKTSDTIFVSSLGDSPMVTASAPIITCERPVVFPKLEVDLASYNVVWEYRGVTIEDSTSIAIDTASTIHYLVSSATGCTSSGSITIIENTFAPTLTIDYPDTLDCQTRELTLEINTNANDINWQGPNGFSSTSISPHVTEAGWYYAIVQDTMNGCESIDSVEVQSLIDFPTYDMYSDTITCNQRQVALPLEISPNYLSIKWLGPNGYTSNMVSPMVNVGGLYNLEITTIGSCIIDTFLQILVDTINPEFVITGGDLTCDNPYVPLIVQLGSKVDHWIWVEPNGDNHSDTSYMTDQVGLHRIEVINDNGCVAIDSIWVQSFINIPQTHITKDGDITCKDSIVTLSSSASTLFHQWYSSDAIALGTGVTVEILEAGIYQVIIRDIYGCTNDTTIEVFANLEIPYLRLSSDDLTCTQSTATIVSEVPLNTDLEWWGPNGFYSQASKIEVNDPGIYYIAIENEFGCKNEGEVIVQLFDERPSIIPLVDDTIIVDPNNLSEQLEVEVNSTVDFDIKWVPSIGLSCDDCLNPHLDSLYQTSYTVTVQNEYGCKDEYTLYLREVDQPIVILIPNVISLNGSVSNGGFTFYSDSDLVHVIEQLTIYDRWGNVVFSERDLPLNDPSLGWQGTFNGAQASQGVYVYSGDVITKKGQRLHFHGDVTVIW